MSNQERQQFQDWFNTHPIHDDMSFKGAAVDQFCWMRDTFSYMLFNALIPEGNGKVPFDERNAMCTVDGTHTSKSVELPVYRWDIDGVTIWVRGNFHDYCVQCSAAVPEDAWPGYLKPSIGGGYYEGMERGKPLEFCVCAREELYAAVKWLVNKGVAGRATKVLGTDHDDREIFHGDQVAFKLDTEQDGTVVGQTIKDGINYLIIEPLEGGFDGILAGEKQHEHEDSSCFRAD